MRFLCSRFHTVTEGTGQNLSAARASRKAASGKSKKEFVRVRNANSTNSRNGTKGARIVLVEDEEPMRTALTRILEHSNYDVQAVGSAGDGVAAVLRNRPDVLVLDVNLPDGTGWTVLRQLAANGITCQMLPTIVYSAGQPAHRRMEEFKPMAFLPKPFPIDALKRLIAEALDQSSNKARENSRNG